jgi:hypothetical protein
MNFNIICLYLSSNWLVSKGYPQRGIVENCFLHPPSKVANHNEKSKGKKKEKRKVKFTWSYYFLSYGPHIFAAKFIGLRDTN